VRRTLLVAAIATCSVLLAASLDAWASHGSSAPWSGTWKRAAGEIDPGGPTTFTMHQVGDHLSGSIPWKGCTTRKGGSMVGWVQGDAAVLAARQTDGTLVLVHLALAPNHAGISGGYQVVAGTCSAAGPFTATRMR
jgi:hypothetical protein